MRALIVCVAVFLTLASLAVSTAFAGRILSLEEALDIAIERSTSVQIFHDQFRLANHNILQSYGNFMPNATLSMNAGRTFIGPTESIAIDSQGRPVQQDGFDYESYSFSLQSQMRVFDWGVNSNTLKQSKHSAEAAKHDLQYQKDIVTAQVIRAYYDYLRKIKLHEVRELSMNASRKNLEQVEAFYQIGSKTRADVLQAKVALANTELALLTAKNQEEIARSTLQAFLIFPLDSDFEIDTSLEAQPMEPALEQEIEFMLSHRSELSSSREKVKSAKSSVVAAQNSRWPTLSAYFFYGWNGREYPENSNFFNNDYNWGMGISLNINIFDRFMTKSGIMRARSQERIAELQLQQAKLDAVVEVVQLVLVLREAGERIELSEETVTQAEENYRLADERYRVGAGTILETIDAEVALTEARVSVIEAKCDFLIARADLQRATGREVKTD